MVYIGVDLHRKRSQVVALDEAGEVLLNRRVPTSGDELLRVFGEAGQDDLQVAFEATFGWGWFADLLVDAGIPAHMVHPRAAKAITAARVKNDAVDAKTLAHLLRTNLLPEAWIAPPAVREARQLVRMRVSLVRIRSRLKCQIHALLAERGVSSSATDLFGRRGRQELAELRLPPISQSRLEANLRIIDELTDELEVADAELLTLFTGDDRVKRLTAIPGIGFTTAATILAEVGEVGRFPAPDRLCSWAGLTPTEHSSAEHTRRGHISKQGSRWLRWVMIEAAFPALRTSQLHQLYAGIASRRGAKIARVAVARRLLTLAFYALRDQRGCRAYPVTRCA
jgi:transposase